MTQEALSGGQTFERPYSPQQVEQQNFRQNGNEFPRTTRELAAAFFSGDPYKIFSDTKAFVDAGKGFIQSQFLKLLPIYTGDRSEFSGETLVIGGGYMAPKWFYKPVAECFENHGFRVEVLTFPSFLLGAPIKGVIKGYEQKLDSLTDEVGDKVHLYLHSLAGILTAADAEEILRYAKSVRMVATGFPNASRVNGFVGRTIFFTRFLQLNNDLEWLERVKEGQQLLSRQNPNEVSSYNLRTDDVFGDAEPFAPKESQHTITGWAHSGAPFSPRVVEPVLDDIGQQLIKAA